MIFKNWPKPNSHQLTIIDYTGLSGLAEKKTDYELSTLQVPSNYQ